jgi:hypothetical protein
LFFVEFLGRQAVGDYIEEEFFIGFEGKDVAYLAI